MKKYTAKLKKSAKNLTMTGLGFIFCATGFCCPSSSTANCSNEMAANCGGIYQTSNKTCSQEGAVKCEEYTYTLCQNGNEYGSVNGTMQYYCEASTSNATCTS